MLVMNWWMEWRKGLTHFVRVLSVGISKQRIIVGYMILRWGLKMESLRILLKL